MHLLIQRQGLMPRVPADASELSLEDQKALQEAQEADVEMSKGETGSVVLPHAHLSYVIDTNEAGEKTATIAGVTVAESLRGHGIGTRLLSEFMVRCVAEKVNFVSSFVISQSGLRAQLRAFGEATIEFFDTVPDQEIVNNTLPITPAQALQSLRLIEQAENRRSDKNPQAILSIGVRANVAAYAAAHPEIGSEVEAYRHEKKAQGGGTSAT